MSNDFSEQSDSNESHRFVLEKELPAYRQAYSDRTAWLMACFSELSYIRFNELLPGKVQPFFLKHLDDLAEGEKVSAGQKKIILGLINNLGYDPAAEKKDLEAASIYLGYSLLECFSTHKTGTQAILLKNANRLVLAFRGTETNSFKDIRADAKAVSVKCVTSGRVHAGFKEAFEDVQDEIESFLRQDSSLSSLPLFITGHSLGGALATIAAKRLDHTGGIAACYTFGAPRVGDDEWINELKAPLYRLVNAADCVTMLPPGAVTVSALSFLVNFIPNVGNKASAFIQSKFGGYLHGGNMRYLTNCAPGSFDKVMLLYSVHLYYRIKGLVHNFLPWTNLLSDHSIKTYRKKLTIIAVRRNK